MSAGRLKRPELEALRASRAGCLALRYARQTGRLVGIYVTEAQHLDGERYTVVCEEHGVMVSASSRRAAARSAVSPVEFCEACADDQRQGRAQ